MRYAYGMGKVSRTSLTVFFATGVLLFASLAHGQDGGAGAGGDGGSGGASTGPCDPNTLWCSNGPMAQIVESHDRLPGDIDTGWLPGCKPPTSDGHCKDEKIQFRAQLAFDPVKTGGPIYSIDMKKGTKLDARWPTTDFIDLTVPPGGATDGTFKVAHTLTPEIALYIDTPVYTGEIKMDASTLINYLPNAQFNYAAMNSTKFRPWAFDVVSMNVKGTDLSSSKLFGITFAQITEILGTNGIDDYVEGSFSFNATTNSTFKYQTTQVEIMTSTGPISHAEGKTQVMSPDGDYLEVQGHAKGIIRYEGVIEFKPVISIKSIAGVGVNLNFPINVGLELDFGSGAIPVSFPNELVHIPLPNVFVPSTPKNFGTVETGGKSEPQKITIDNTGELGALLEFSSSSNQFKIVGAGATEIGPDDDYVLEVRFQPTKSGKQTGKIIVKSNDPDTPLQEFQVTGHGEGVDLPDPDPEPDGTGGSGGDGSSGSVYSESDDGGCGCRTVGGDASGASASLALLGLLGLLLRRRR